jgi:glucan biosynthesis protein
MLGRARAIIDNNQGGMFFLIVTTTGKMMERELRRRAQIHNKPYRAEYWGKAKLEYDAGVRQLNAVKKHLHPDEYAHIIFKGDFSIWDGVPYHLLTEFYNNKDLWYDNPDQR